MMEQSKKKDCSLTTMDTVQEDNINSSNYSSQMTEAATTKRLNYLHWDDYFMAVAFLSAMRSKDPCSQVGACIVDQNKKIYGIGYNGMPRGCSDNLLPWKKVDDNKLNTKYMYVCHAEMNAILNKNSADVAGCIIYVVLFPCNECAKLIIQSGIKEVFYFSDKHKHKPETIASKRLFDLANISYRKYVPLQKRIILDFTAIDEARRAEWINRNDPTNDLTSSVSNVSLNNINRDVNSKREDYLGWEEFYMSIAFLSAQRSKDPSTQVGACIVSKDNKIVGIGYNGMPRGCHDDLMPWARVATDKLQTKYMYVCHAEVNAIMNKNCANVANCTLYVGLFPCNECAKIIIQSQITKIVYFSDKYSNSPETLASKKMFDMTGIFYRSYTHKLHKITIDFDSIDWNSNTASHI